MLRHLTAASATMLFFSTALSAASPTLTEDEAAAFVQRFCATLVSAIADYDPNAAGVWPPDDPSVFSPLVTPQLTEMIEQSIEHNSAFQEATDEKPPLGDGVPWKGYQDAASDCTAGVISGTGERREVEVHYQYYDDSTQGWTDRLVLYHHAGEWRVNDILYGAFDYTSGLRSALTEVMNEPIPQ